MLKLLQTLMSSVLLVGSFGCLFAVSVNAEVLEGSIEVKERLPAIQPELRAGAIFNEANLPQMGTQQSWQWIPSWAAGMWHREMQTDFLPTGAVTSLSRTKNERQVGDQVDRNGGIWTHINLPSKCAIEADKYVEYQILTEAESIVTTEARMVRRVRVLAIMVKKSNSRIFEIDQKEQFDTYRPGEKGNKFQDGWLVTYNERGKQLSSVHCQSHYTQVDLFEPINIDPKTGLDLREDFKNYLLSHGLANLVPIDQSAQVSSTK